MELFKTATQGLPLSDLVPRVEVRLLNFISDGSRGFPAFNERMKMVTVKIFSRHFALTTYLSVEKKRLRRSLVDTTDKIIDIDWVLSYWLRYMKYKQKTVHQVVPVTRFPVMKWIFKTFVCKPFYAIPGILVICSVSAFL